MLTDEQLPKKIECFLPPCVMLAPYSQQRYAIIGGKWIACDESVTTEKLQSRWSRPALVKEIPSTPTLKAYVKSSSGEGHYTVEYKNNMWSCTCASFGFRRRCKHIDQVKSKK